VKAFFINCRTGCSCCSSDNHWRGPYTSRAIADEKATTFEAIPLVASQYARRGRYEISEYDAEALPNGRLIVNDRVFHGWADTGDDEIQQPFFARGE
jgi:hypothetical protein